MTLCPAINKHYR